MPEPDYAELHCHSCFSLLDGAATPEDLVKRAAELGMRSLALTDHNGVYGAVRMFKACQAAGIHPVFGAELDIYGEQKLVLLAEDRRGWGNLCWLITQAQQHGGKGQAVLPAALLSRERCRGLIGLYGGADEQELLWLRDLLAPGTLYLQLQRHFLPDDLERVSRRLALARALRLPVVATNDVHYAQREGQRLHDTLVAIRHNLTVEEARPYLRANSEYYLKSPAEMAALFNDLPEALHNTVRIADRCQVEIAFRTQALPPQPQLQGRDPDDFLTELCDKALPSRYPPARLPKAAAQVAHELDVIRQTRLAGFFLLVWDVVSWARQQGIMVRGRGSAANSIVTYLLGITTVDPLEHNLLFERFLTPDTRSMPDIDLDFCSKRREEVIQYVYTTYGAAHTAMVCNYITYQRRSAIRDVGKALGISPEILDSLAKQGFKPGTRENLADDVQQVLPQGISEHTWELFETLCQQIRDYPRHLSIHVGGMLITACPLNELVPLEPATMPGRVVVQWDKDNIEDAGLIKLDLLSLRTFTAIDECLQIIQQTTGRRPDIDTLPLDDKAVYDDLCAGDTIGAFQVESRAQMQGLAQMQPRRFGDLVIEVALIRPGPLQGGMVHPFYRRRQGLEPVTFPHPSLEPVLGDTMGVIVFQEQVMQVAMAVGGLSAVEAARLRRAISGHRSTDEVLALQQQFLAGARQHGISQEYAEELFERMIAFASKYGFCRSHAAAFAKTAYDSLWLRHYYPAAYYCSVLNSEPMGFYAPRIVVADARRHGVAVRGVDVNASSADCILEGGAIRMGLRYVHGWGDAVIERFLAERTKGNFCHLDDLCWRTRLPRREVESLILAGALDRWGKNRRELLWRLGQLRYTEEALPLAPIPDTEPPVDMMTTTEDIMAEYKATSVSAQHHLCELLRGEFATRGIASSLEMNNSPAGRRLTVAGILAVWQRPPTARGFCFITLEDEFGMMNVIVQPDIFQRQPEIWSRAVLLRVTGEVQRSRHQVNLMAETGARLWVHQQGGLELGVSK